jgi:hypothetical protein
MADIRINALATTAASTASDDFIAIDGSANGTRKLNAFSPTFGGNLTVSGTGTSSVAGVFKAGTDIVTGDTSAFQVHNNVDDKPMVGFYRGGTLRNVLRLNTDNDFRLLSSDLSTPANLTAGNLTVSGTGGALFNTTTAADFGNLTGQITLNGSGLKPLLIGSTTTYSGIQSYNSFLSLNPTGNNVVIGTPTDLGYRIGINGASDKQLILDVSAGGRYTSQYWANSGSIKAQAYYDNTANSFRIGASAASSSTILVSGGDTTALTLDSSQNATFAGSVKAASEVYAEKSGAGIAGQSTGLITQFTTVNNTTYSVTTAAAKVFVVQLGSGDAALCYTSYKSSTITILGSDGTIVNSNSPSSTQLGIWKGANDHVIYFVTGTNALAGSYGSWGFCFLGNPIISIA